MWPKVIGSIRVKSWWRSRADGCLEPTQDRCRPRWKPCGISPCVSGGVALRLRRIRLRRYPPCGFHANRRTCHATVGWVSRRRHPPIGLLGSPRIDVNLRQPLAVFGWQSGCCASTGTLSQALGCLRCRLAAIAGDGMEHFLKPYVQFERRGAITLQRPESIFHEILLIEWHDSDACAFGR